MRQMEFPMRQAFSRGTVKGMLVLPVLLALLVFESLVFGQSSTTSKRNLSQQSLLREEQVTGGFVPVRGLPPATTDTWTGGGGANTNWSDASNWNNGAITSGENILINLTSAATAEDNSPTIGTLTLSNAGDSVTVLNNTTLTVDGNISNAGIINLASGGNNP